MGPRAERRRVLGSSLGVGGWGGARGPVGAGSGAAGRGAGTAGEGAARGPWAPGEEGSDLTGRARELPRRRRRRGGEGGGGGRFGSAQAGVRAGLRGPAAGTRDGRGGGPAAAAAAVRPQRQPASRPMLVSQPDRWAGKEFEAFALFKLPVDSP